MNPPLKYAGGKYYLAGPLWDLAEPILPDVVHCVEPYCGGMAWTLEGLARGLEKSFCVNDMDFLLMNFWGRLANRTAFAEFNRRCEASPFSEVLWEAATHLVQHARSHGGLPLMSEGAQLDAAHAFFVCCRQSLAGRMKSFAPLSKTRTRRGMNEQVSAWLSAVKGLPEVHEALRKVALLCDDALKVIDSEDDAKTLFYLDPPYLHSTRTGHTKDDYAFEMTEDEHGELLERLGGIKGRFMLSGYPSDLYDCAATKYSWRRHEFDMPNNASHKTLKQRTTECVWCNF